VKACLVRRSLQYSLIIEHPQNSTESSLALKARGLKCRLEVDSDQWRLLAIPAPHGLRDKLQQESRAFWIPGRVSLARNDGSDVHFHILIASFLINSEIPLELNGVNQVFAREKSRVWKYVARKGASARSALYNAHLIIKSGNYSTKKKRADISASPQGILTWF